MEAHGTGCPLSPLISSGHDCLGVTPTPVCKRLDKAMEGGRQPQCSEGPGQACSLGRSPLWASVSLWRCGHTQMLFLGLLGKAVEASEFSDSCQRTTDLHLLGPSNLLSVRLGQGATPAKHRSSSLSRPVRPRSLKLVLSKQLLSSGTLTPRIAGPSVPRSSEQQARWTGCFSRAH